jgi:BASS family bile acid:Na+ symporter
VPTVLQIAPAVVTVVLMFAVGLSIGPRDLRAALARPGLLLLLVGLQVALIPPLGLGLARLMANATPNGRDAALWILLLASCPGGAISNALVLYGRGDVAMSVLMTAATSLLAAITMPVVLLAMRGVDLVPPLEVPGTTLLAQSMVLLLLPCVLGMSVRRLRRGEAEWMARCCGSLGGVLLVGTLAVAMIEQRAALASVWPVAIGAALLFVVGAGSLGALIALAGGLEADRRFTVVVEFAVRNIAAAFAISVLSFGRDDFAAFGAVYLVAEVTLIAGFAALRRRTLPRTISSR